MGSEAARQVGERLRELRRQRGLSQEQLAHEIETRQPTVSWWEQGHSAPSLDMLYRIAAVLGCDVHDLLPPELPPPPRSITRAIGEQLPLGARFQGSLELFLRVAMLIDAPEPRLQVYADDADEAALSLLRSAHVKEPPVNPASLAAAVGVRVLRWDSLDDELAGLLVAMPDGPLIAHNGQHPHGRQRFTVAHELGHYLLGHLDTFHVDLVADAEVPSRPGYDRVHEKEANAFAAELLMPSKWVNEMTGGSIEDLASRFEVSTVAMGYRLMGLGLIREEGGVPAH